MFTPSSLMAAAFLVASAAAAPANNLSTSVAPTPTTALKTVSGIAIPATCLPSPPPSQSLYEAAVLAPSNQARQNLFNQSSLFFDFQDQCRTVGVVESFGGKTIRADHATFPALVGNGGSITMGFIKPCGFNTPHVHPRAAEMNVVVAGTLFASVTAENGVQHVNHTLTQYSMTVFPAGAIHTEFNPDCTDAVFVAGFGGIGGEDPGVGQIVQEFFGFEDDLIAAAVGGELQIAGADIDAWRTKIPANVVRGVESCLAKCNIAKRSIEEIKRK